MRPWWSRLAWRFWNLLTQFQWTDCQHKRRTYGPKYFPYCVDCGASFSDYYINDEGVTPEEARKHFMYWGGGKPKA